MLAVVRKQPLLSFRRLAFRFSRAVSTKASAPLAGIKVLELASVLAGPSCGQFLRELGADVIKVENPRTRGDVTRGWRLPKEVVQPGSVTAYFSSCNLGKKSLALDASLPKGKEILKELAVKADVVLASYKPGDAEKLGVDFASLSNRNPRLVYAQITGYGQDDPRVGYDALIQAESGFTFMNGEPDPAGCSTKMPVALVDLLAAHQLKEAIILALWRRDKTGEGSQLQVSLLGAAVASLANQATGYLCTGTIPKRMGSDHPSIVPYGTIFECGDGLPLVLAVGADSQFKSLCEVLGLVDLFEKFPKNAERVGARDEIKARISESLRSHTREEVLQKNDQA